MKITIKLLLILIALTTSKNVLSQGGENIATAALALFDSTNIATTDKSFQYYYFISDFNGYVEIGTCSNSTFHFNACDTLSNNLVYVNSSICNNNYSTIVKVNKGKYYINAINIGKSNSDSIQWFLTKIQDTTNGFSFASPFEANIGQNLRVASRFNDQWYSFNSSESSKILIELSNPNDAVGITIHNKMGEWVSDCQKIDDITYYFYANTNEEYLIRLICDGTSNDFNWNLSTGEMIPGESCLNAIVVDTGINVFHGNNLQEQYFKYQATKNGRLTARFCNASESALCNLEAYIGDCKNLHYIHTFPSIGCNNRPNSLFSYLVDSGTNYKLKLFYSLKEEFNWELEFRQPLPGEYIHLAIPVTINDTISSPVYDDGVIWYRYKAQESGILCIDTETNSDNYSNALFRVGIEQVDSSNISMKDYLKGTTVKYSVTKGQNYLISIFNSDTISWTLKLRDALPGETCSLAMPTDYNVINTLPSDSVYMWYKYTADSNRYIAISESEYTNASGKYKFTDYCDFTCNSDSNKTCFEKYVGFVMPVEKNKEYYIRVNLLNNENLNWMMYNPTDIRYFNLRDQLEPTVFDYENHEISITVASDFNISSSMVDFLTISGIEYYIDSERIFSYNSTINFSQPVQLLVKYINEQNRDTLSQTWTINVIQEKSPEPPTGPYEVKSEYLINPDLAKPLVAEWADFWKEAYDTEYGGFFTNVTNDGVPVDEVKTTLTQARNAYAFAKAFMVTGDTSYLRYASGALEFMYDHLWDSNNGGWYSSVNKFGEKANDQFNNTKWSFIQHYATLGIVAFADATGGYRLKNTNQSNNYFNEEMQWEKLNEALNVINTKMWDDRTDYLGYYENAEEDWSSPHGKGFTPTVDGITTHGLYMYLLTKEDFFENKLEILANNMSDWLIPGMKDAVIGYPESYSSDWEQQQGGDMFIGHMFKTAWCLARAYMVNPQDKYKNAASTLMYDMMDNGGYDFTYGAPYTNYDWTTGYIDKNTKSWWDVEQGFMSGITNYYISSDEDEKDDFLEVTDGSLDFFMNHFVDSEYGDVFGTTDRIGNARMGDKGFFWKAAYHSTEMAFYTYLYGNLMYTGKPVELFYFIDAANEEQTISLYPLAIQDSYLKITAIELNGDEFTSFDQDTRTLTIPANEGGIFKVTFENKGAFTNLKHDLANNSTLGLNIYPNPTKEICNYNFTLNKSAKVELSIIDISGRSVYYKELHELKQGTYTKQLNTAQLKKSGLYFFKLKANNIEQTIKLIKID